MPFEKCIRHKGKIYCWNSETEQIEEITSKPVSIADCPGIVILDLLRLISRDQKGTKGD